MTEHQTMSQFATKDDLFFAQMRADLTRATTNTKRQSVAGVAVRNALRRLERWRKHTPVCSTKGISE